MAASFPPPTAAPPDPVAAAAQPALSGVEGAVPKGWPQAARSLGFPNWIVAQVRARVLALTWGRRGRHGPRPPVRFYNSYVTVRRLKTYTGTQGYVYQYYFVGSRPAVAAELAATEYVFDVTSDRKTTFSVSVFLPDDAISSWTSQHGRALTEAERYAAAKLRLFRGFDEIENMMADGRSLPIDTSLLQDLLQAVGVI